MEQICRVCPDAFDTISQSIQEEDSASTDSDTMATEGKGHMVNKKEERGLSDLVRQCLGQPLEKKQQMSDWERRPLRPSQIHYAGGEHSNYHH